MENEKLKDCYDKLKKILSPDIEPYQSVELVEKYRQFWNPAKVKKKVKIILLAESHVFTSDDDRKILLKSRDELLGYPSEYAKFVYCLAYGEPQLTNNIHPAGDGTPPVDEKGTVLFNGRLCSLSLKNRTVPFYVF